MKREDAREMAVGGLVKMQAGEHAALQDAAAYLNSQMRIEPDRNVFAGAGRIIHHIQWQHPAMVQGFTVVDKSDFNPSRLTVPSDSLYDQEALHVSYFKRRGSLWLSTCSCFCLCSSFSSLARYFGVFPGSIFSLPMLKLRGDERWSTVSSNPAPRTIAPPVVWPPASQQVLIHRLGRCGHGTR